MTTTRILYLLVTSTYYTHNTNISKEDREVGVFMEMEKFVVDIVLISKSMSRVCAFFHAAITLPKEHLFRPGATISLKF